MRGEKFDRVTGSFTCERMADFLDYRYRLLTAEQGNICEAKENISHAPFYLDGYPYARLIGDMSSEPWSTLCATDPVQLLHPDPFEPSALRKRDKGGPHYRVWDSAIAIPECKLRSGMVYGNDRVPIIRHINTHWDSIVRTSFGHIGPLGPNGKVLRPVGEYVLDLTAMGVFGWTVREAIHVLAHLRADCRQSNSWVRERNKIASSNVTAALEIAYAIIYDVPLNVTSRENEPQGTPETYYGVRLMASTQVKTPVLRIPWIGGDALRVDSALAAMLGAVFIEPVPYGFLASSTNCYPEDIWSMGPSLIALVGWESVDYITHMPLGSLSRNANSSVDYVVRGEALLPPATHWAYLALGNKDRDKPDTDSSSTWMYFKDWLSSDEYQDLRAQTPDLPCKHCYSVNQDTDGAPKRPHGKHPKGPERTWPLAWREYYADIDRCLGFIRKAVDAYQPMYYSGVDLRRLDRKKRQAAHNKKLKHISVALSDKRNLDIAIRKVKGRMDGALTERQRKLYIEHEKGTKHG